MSYPNGSSAEPTGLHPGWPGFTWTAPGFPKEGGCGCEAELPCLGFAPVNPGIERKYWKKTSCKNSKIVPKFTNYASLLFRQKFVFGFLLSCALKPRTQSTTGLLGGAKFGGSESCHDVMKNFNHLSLRKVAFCRPHFFCTSLSCSLEKNPGRCLASVYTWRFSRPSRMYLIPWNRCRRFWRCPCNGMCCWVLAPWDQRCLRSTCIPWAAWANWGGFFLVARFVKGECETHEPPNVLTYGKHQYIHNYMVLLFLFLILILKVIVKLRGQKCKILERQVNKEMQQYIYIYFFFLK